MASNSQKSAFSENGLKAELQSKIEEIQSIYKSDSTPWVIGYSGGKDSTAVVQLTWLALADLPAEERTKNVYVITTDTMVENPVVAGWVNQSLNTIEEAAQSQNMPFKPKLITPDIQKTFWVNLIGRGYPAPRNQFRWCTERLKIKPSSNYIETLANTYGEVVLLLGTRKAESSVRSAVIDSQQESDIEEHATLLNQHPDLTNTIVYVPIKEWANDDVWTFLLQIKNPWGYSNKDLMALYRGATADNECPVVVDTTTPSCGNSRFGCWVCTLVDEDKSMTAMINNDAEKDWMLPLLEIRNEFDYRGDERRKRDRERRDFRRMTGQLTPYENKEGNWDLVHGPYLPSVRAYFLERVLSAQAKIQKNPRSPEYVRNLELISLNELQEIRRIWIEEKHEIEDLVPLIWEKTIGTEYPGKSIDENIIFDRDALELLKEVCDDEPLLYETTRNLLDIERRYRSKAARRGLNNDLIKTIEKGFFKNEEDALSFVKEQKGLEEESADYSVESESGNDAYEVAMP